MWSKMHFHCFWIDLKMLTVKSHWTQIPNLLSKVKPGANSAVFNAN